MKTTLGFIASMAMATACHGETPTPAGSTNAAAKASAIRWETSFDAVTKLATEKHLPILAVFSGSDWCPSCMKLDREVFSQPEFDGFAKASLVLFVADFPRQTPQSKELAEQNRRLAEQFGISAIPAVLLLDADGKVLARTGFRPGGAESYVKHLKELLKK